MADSASSTQRRLVVIVLDGEALISLDRFVPVIA
jgi:hypothetical protein